MTVHEPTKPSACKDWCAAALAESRRRMEELVGAVDDARLCAQPDRLMAPLVWDYSHVGVYEELWAVRALGGAPIGDDAHLALYDPIRYPRAVRGSLPLWSRREVGGYLSAVRSRALALLEDLDLEGGDPLARGGFAHRMVAEHEHQHCETALQALQMLPGWRVARLPRRPSPSCQAGSVMVEVPAGRYPVGAVGHAPWDNERGRHEVELRAFRIARFPVTNAEFCVFVEDGGYRRRALWSDAGWAMVRAEGLAAPKHWRREGSAWMTERFGHAIELDQEEPVIHVSWYEADAFARWARKRLPTEEEWEVAATWDPRERRAHPWPWGDAEPTPDRANLDFQHERSFGPAPVGSLPRGRSALGCEQMVGDVWEWTASDFRPYPGFSPFPYREYSAVFFGAGYKVLRGGSWATHPRVARPTFRNWDLPQRRQIFAGLRLAEDGE